MLKHPATLSMAKAKAAQLNEKLLATDKRLRRSVAVNHQDGSFLFFRFAFVVRWKGWVIVLAEHHEPHVYDVSDLRSVRSFGPEL